MADTEQLECIHCGNLNGLRENCPHCEGRGIVTKEVDPKHRTLSQIRSSNGAQRDPGRYGAGGAVGPRRIEPDAQVTE